MRQVRAAVRAFLLTATVEEMQRELEISVERGDTVRAGYVEECLREAYADEPEVVDCDDSRGRKVGVCSHCQTGSIGLTGRGNLVRHNVRNGGIGYPYCNGSGTLPECTYYV